MPLSPVIEIAIGLMFVYLILSLLASEIQELIATLLQWRADHLKKSIEMLLAGGSEARAPGMGDAEVEADVQRAKNLADRLYANPLINTLNYQAKGIFAETFRRAFRWIYQTLQFNTAIFGRKTSGPSYIPATKFAEGLLTTLRVPDMVHLVSARRVRKLTGDLLSETKRILQFNLTDPVVVPLVDRLAQQLGAIDLDYKNRKFPLDSTLDRIARLFDRFIAALETRSQLPEIKDLKLFSNETFGDPGDREVLLATLLPSTHEILEGIRTKRTLYQELSSALTELASPEDPTRQGIEDVLSWLPVSVQNSLSLIAQQAQQKTSSVKQDLNTMQAQLEQWFNDAQDRAQGVYRRNARGIAILIGVVMAVAANADTFYIVNRLSKDAALRGAVEQAAEQAITSSATPQDVRSQIDPILRQIDQPLGWSEEQWQRQYAAYLDCDPTVTAAAASNQAAVTGQKSMVAGKVCQMPRDPLTWAWLWFRITLGWLITGIAISMGSPFWFDLLGKIVRVKNSGSNSSNPNT